MREHRIRRFFTSHPFEHWAPALVILFLLVLTTIKVANRLQAQSPAPTVTDKEIVRVLDPTNGVACYIFRDSGAISCVKFTK